MITALKSPCVAELELARTLEKKWTDTTDSEMGKLVVHATTIIIIATSILNK